MKPFDFLIVGAGIYGLSAAVALRKRGFRVAILNPGQIPHPLAASTDISKVVRMEYGADREYMDMVDEAINGWHAWNDLFQEQLYHEVGFLMLSKPTRPESGPTFEAASYANLIAKGYQPEQLSPEDLAGRFPAFNARAYSDAVFNPRAGFAESGRVVAVLLKYARGLGVEVFQQQTAHRFLEHSSQVSGVQTLEGTSFSAGHTIVCTGAYTPYLLPELASFMKSTGHPVFHLQPERPEDYQPPRFSVFTSDISHTGWYGFPLHPREGVVKIANHGIGLELHPDRDARLVGQADILHLRQFLYENLPGLAQAPIVFTRRCLYNDTLDGHFWIDRHPERTGLSVGAGGSGHAFKMAPILGDMIADAAEGKGHKWSERYRWRNLDTGTRQEEAARHKLA
ncbi:MAG: FAD-dependent oxidoreductase [Saprospiraceae bacterium]|nr:FAD-dependent oxidoreductase [Saprospiraceae bacterium]